MDLTDEILTYSGMFDKRGTISANLIKKNSLFHNTALNFKIIDATSFLKDGVSLTERVYCLLHNVTASITCEECSAPAPFINGRRGYRAYCGPGCANRSKSKINAVKSTCCNRYGLLGAKQRNISSKSAAQINSASWLFLLHRIRNQSIKTIADSYGVSQSLICKRLRSFNIDIQSKGSRNISTNELAVVRYIKETINADVITNSRSIISPKELDIFLPEYNLAIEINGVYWHRPLRFSGKQEWLDYHNGKEEACRKIGIQLLHLWDNYGDHKLLISDALAGKISNNLEKVYTEINWP